MFSEQTDKLLDELIQAEYKNACEQAKKEFGDEYINKYHSLYEGYSILLEEIEETEWEIEKLKDAQSMLWDGIKGIGNPLGDINFDLIDERALCAIKELLQVIAVTQKLRETFGGRL